MMIAILKLCKSSMKIFMYEFQEIPAKLFQNKYMFDNNNRFSLMCLCSSKNIKVIYYEVHGKLNMNNGNMFNIFVEVLKSYILIFT